MIERRSFQNQTIQKYILNQKLHKQDGFTIVAAIFILVVLAILAVSIINISAITKATLVNSVLGNRAFYAAKAGLEWEVFNVKALTDCPTDRTLNLNQGGLKGFEVDVTCSRTDFLEGEQLVKIYKLNSLARSGNFGDEDFASRELVMSIFTVEDIP